MKTLWFIFFDYLPVFPQPNIWAKVGLLKARKAWEGEKEQRNGATVLNDPNFVRFYKVKKYCFLIALLFDYTLNKRVQVCLNTVVLLVGWGFLWNTSWKAVEVSNTLRGRMMPSLATDWGIIRDSNFWRVYTSTTWPQINVNEAASIHRKSEVNSKWCRADHSSEFRSRIEAKKSLFLFDFSIINIAIGS